MFWLLAQETAEEGGSILTNYQPFFLMAIIFALMWFMFIRPQRKQEQNRKAMIAAITKNDRVLMNGGLFGTVMNAKDGEDEITIRIDDNRDVKVR
ncbi:MAG: preprotein translocase subunit YajC, partial [Planctomycetota bacterium]